MALKDYNKAFRYGKKEYESRLLAGRKPTLESLDEVLPDEALSTESLGLVQIPIDQIVGTRYSGRSSAFASNFSQYWRVIRSLQSNGQNSALLMKRKEFMSRSRRGSI